MSSVDPIRPISGPPEIQPLRKRKREEREQREEPAEEPQDDSEPDEDPRPSVDFRV